MSRFLLCLLLIALTGCSTGNWRLSPEDSAAGKEKVAVIESTATTEPMSEEDSEQALLGDSETDMLDPETLEDMQLLSGADQTPPEDEGVTVVEDEIIFDLPVVENDKVRYFIDYYSGPARNGFVRWLERSGRYLPMMREIFAEEGLPMDLTYLAMIESGFNDRAVSSAKATGSWQFMESTGRIYGLENDWWRDERRDTLKATRAAARHLGDLYRRFDDWYLAIAAYNAGSGKVERAIKLAESRDFWKLARGTYLKPETKNYVPRFLAVLILAKEVDKYQFSEISYQPPLEFDVVKLPSSTDLDIIARLCGVSYEEIRNFNPELKRWCTPPDSGAYPVRIPIGKAESFRRQYASIAPDRRANFHRHRIKPGDTLLGLASRYGIKMNEIVALNGITNPRALKVGRDLILPLQPGATFSAAAIKGDSVRTGRTQSYKVRKGDNLWSISRRFQVSTKEICVWNGLSPSKILQPGQVLKIVGSGGKNVSNQKKMVYQVRPGDTLWAISRRFDLKTRDIMTWNNLKSSHVLQPGDRLTLLLSGDKAG